MKLETLHIDNMVCPRCATAVTEVLKELGWEVRSVELGSATGIPPAGWTGEEELERRLQRIGLKLADEGSLIGRMKGLIIEYVHHEKKWPNQVLSDVLAESLNRSYGHLSRNFSEVADRTIEDFYQAHRIERARQLLHQTDLPISEIAPQLRYGTAAHFSNSFRQHTGQSPSAFKRSKNYVPKDLTRV
ncbi:helix-turn-helix domain-containing protein [Neolewinella antarctica]|uniref:AraC-like DNA-binding protein n=1 Tax=Neolewinella antarctica TaxID=442734 RepID=A0ABX0X9A9_9BACT|nr:helix-turn-helix domain-containing protein [Neolewinella antarctica]NJC25845.1 AraC-like DNA-binding protein [Neolewinella antarctica]